MVERDGCVEDNAAVDFLEGSAEMRLDCRHFL